MSAHGRQHRKENKTRDIKRMRALDRELRQLWRRRYEAEPIPLEQPFQRGWVRYFMWSEKARLREDFVIMEGLLDLMQHKQWSRRRDFLASKRRWRRVEMGWKPRLSFHPNQLLHKCRDVRWPKYFAINRYRPINGIDHLRELRAAGWNGKVRFIYPELLEPCVEPFMVTHQRLHDPVAEARIAEIEAWVDRRGGWDVVHRALGRRSWRHENERQKKFRRLDHKEVGEEMERRAILRAFRFLVSLKACEMTYGICRDVSNWPAHMPTRLVWG